MINMEPDIGEKSDEYCKCNEDTIGLRVATTSLAKNNISVGFSEKLGTSLALSLS